MTTLISQASKAMLKVLQARLQQYMNHELQMFKLDLEKAEEAEIKLPTSTGSSKKQESSRKTSTSALLIMPKPLCRSQQTVENSSGDGNTRPPYLPPEKFVFKKQQLELDMEQWTGSKLVKEYINLYIVTLLI